MQIRSTRRYWHMTENSDIYDGIFAANRMVGVVGSLDTVSSTWFGSNVEYSHCINMMPFTPITEELLLHSFIKQEWPVLAGALDRYIAEACAHVDCFEQSHGLR